MKFKPDPTHSWQRSPNFPILPTPFFPSLHPCHLQPLTPLLFLLSCFFGWMGDRATWCAVLLNDIMNLHMSSLGTRRTLIMSFMQQGVKFTRSDICVFLLVLWLNITHTHTHTHSHIHTQRHTTHSRAKFNLVSSWYFRQIFVRFFGLIRGSSI